MRKMEQPIYSNPDPSKWEQVSCRNFDFSPPNLYLNTKEQGVVLRSYMPLKKYPGGLIFTYFIFRCRPPDMLFLSRSVEEMTQPEL